MLQLRPICSLKKLPLENEKCFLIFFYFLGFLTFVGHENFSSPFCKSAFQKRDEQIGHNIYTNCKY